MVKEQRNNPFFASNFNASNAINQKLLTKDNKKLERTESADFTSNIT